MRDILTILVHFYLSWRSHQLSVRQVHQEFKPIAGQRWDSAQLHQWAGSYFQYSLYYNISILQNFIISIFQHFNNFRIQPICNLITGFAQLHRLPLPSLTNVDSNPLPRHHLPRLRHQRWWQCGGKGNQQHYSWNGYWTLPLNNVASIVWCWDVESNLDKLPQEFVYVLARISNVKTDPEELMKNAENSGLVK